MTSLPRCLCRKSKSVDFWGADLDDDGLTFRCKYRNCQFKQLVEQGKGTCGVVDGGVGVEDEDNYDYADPFIDDDRSDEDEYEEEQDVFGHLHIGIDGHDNLLGLKPRIV